MKKLSVFLFFATFSITAFAADIDKDQNTFHDQIDQLSRYNPFLNGSDAQKFFQQNTTNHPEIVRAIDLVTQSRNRATLLYVEMGWALAMMTLRIWMYSRSKSWVQRFFQAIANTATYWIFAAFLIPWLILGAPYLAIWKSIFNS